MAHGTEHLGQLLYAAPALPRRYRPEVCVLSDLRISRHTSVLVIGYLLGAHPTGQFTCYNTGQITCS